MDSEEGALTIEELAERYGVRPRTIYFYITKGLLPSPGSRGRSVRYGEEYQVRLQLIVLCSRRHLPLAEIRESLSGRSLDELRRDLAREEELARLLRPAGAGEEAAPREEPRGDTTSPRDFIGALLSQAREMRPAAAQPRVSPPAPAPTSAKRDGGTAGQRRPTRRGTTPAATWRRWELAPGVELHVREDAVGPHGELIDRVLRAANEDDTP